MKIEINEYNNLQLTEVYNPVVFKTEKNEELIVTMRDSGFEIDYMGTRLELKNFTIKKLVGQEII